jgi:dihydrofolate reductase
VPARFHGYEYGDDRDNSLSGVISSIGIVSPSNDRDRKSKPRADHPLWIGGPTLSALAIRAGLVDEVRMLISPVSVGSGIVYLRYRVAV